MAKNDPTSEFRLYVVHGGPLTQVSNPMHMRVLAALEDGPRTSAELQEITGKASSTLFVHMEALVDMGLVSAEASADDSRKKVYSLNAMHLMSSKPRDPEALDSTIGYICGLFGEEEWSVSMVRAVLMAMDASGIDISPMMGRIGEGIADGMFARAGSDRMEDMMQYLKDSYASMGIGEISIYAFAPLTVIFKDSLSIPHMGHTPKYAMTMGIVCRLLGRILGRRCGISSCETYGESGEYLRFVVEPVLRGRRQAPGGDVAVARGPAEANMCQM